jgi:hypothetical protein
MKSQQKYLKEDDIVGKLHDPMEVEEIGSPHSFEGKESQESAPP